MPTCRAVAAHRNGREKRQRASVALFPEQLVRLDYFTVIKHGMIQPGFLVTLAASEVVAEHGVKSGLLRPLDKVHVPTEHGDVHVGDIGAEMHPRQTRCADTDRKSTRLNSS